MYGCVFCSCNRRVCGFCIPPTPSTRARQHAIKRRQVSRCSLNGSEQWPMQHGHGSGLGVTHLVQWCFGLVVGGPSNPTCGLSSSSQPAPHVYTCSSSLLRPVHVGQSVHRFWGSVGRVRVYVCMRGKAWKQFFCALASVAVRRRAAAPWPYAGCCVLSLCVVFMLVAAPLCFLSPQIDWCRISDVCCVSTGRQVVYEEVLSACVLPCPALVDMCAFVVCSH